MSRRATESTDARTAKPVSRRYELRWPSFLYIATALFLAVGAVNSQNNLLYWAFGAAVCGVVISGIISGGTMLALRVTRDPVGSPHVGETLSIGYSVLNRHRFLPAFAVLIEELGTEISRKSGLSGFEAKPAIMAHCAPRNHARAQANLVAIRRGRTELRYVRASSSFPFGLVRKSVIFDLQGSVLTLPAIARARGLERRVRTRSSRASAGTRAMNPQGAEFHSIAEYTPGDSLVKIAWKRSAALGELVVRRTASSLPSRPWVVLADDLTEATHQDQELAICCAASIASQLAKQGIAVGLSTPWSHATVTPAPGQRSLHRVYKALALVDWNADPDRSRHVPGAGDEKVTVSVSGRTGAEHVNARALESWLASGETLPDDLTGAEGRP